jgi:hypothetical protein
MKSFTVIREKGGQLILGYTSSNPRIWTYKTDLLTTQPLWPMVWDIHRGDITQNTMNNIFLNNSVK